MSNAGFDIALLKPTTLDGIKRLAKQIAKRDDIKHVFALEAAAKQAGYHDFRQARKKLLTHGSET